MDVAKYLLDLYGIRNELEHKVLGMGIGDPDDLRKIDEQIERLEKRVPAGAGFGPIATAPAPVEVATAECENKIVIHIDSKKGIYIDDGRRYPISGKRLQCVQKFRESDSLTTEDLEQFWSTSSQITNEIKKINSLVREKLEIEHDLITHSTSDRSYSLNREKLEIPAS